jgi:hypothetical protein
VSGNRTDISVDLGKLDAADVILTDGKRIEAMLVLRSRGTGARLTISLDPDDLFRLSSVCADADHRFSVEIDRRDEEAAS